MSSAYAKKYVKDNIVQSKNGTGTTRRCHMVRGG